MTAAPQTAASEEGEMNRRTTSLSAVAGVTTLLALVAGCASASSSGPASTATQTTAPASSAAPSSTGAPQQALHSCVSHTLTVSLADNNKSLCVTTGTVVAVYLHGTLSDRWGAIRSSSVALAPKANPRLTLQVGITGAAFEAIHPGVATISSARYPCQARTSGPGAPSPATQCGSPSDFRVTLTVKSG
jgi:hypothetical protein